MAEIARNFGDEKSAYSYESIANGSKKAYNRFAELDTNRQAKLVRPLTFGLLGGNKKNLPRKDRNANKTYQALNFLTDK